MQYKLKNIITEEQPLIQVLKNRGVLDTYHYLNTSSADIHKPQLLNNIDTGVIMLLRHIQNLDKTYIQVDSDCDGYTSAALLLNYLYHFFPTYVENCITWGLHSEKQHGINLDKITDDIKFIIVPDASSNEYEIHRQLQEKGIDILIIDHHEAEKVSEYACVINNQLDNYPNKTLCGGGVVYKFCCYLDELLKTDAAQNFQDLAAVALIGDLMDIRDYETKELIQEGLKNIHNPYISGMIAKDDFHFSSGINPHKVAFYIVPMINAVARMGTLDDKEILFQSMLTFKANNLIPSTKRGEKGKEEKIVTQALRMCTNLKKAQTTQRDSNVEIIEKIIERDNLLAHKLLVICLEKKLSVDKNLTGLIANELADKYKRPVLLLNETNDGKWSGSGRNFAGSPITELKNFLLSTQLVDLCEGHQNAFGFIISNQNLYNFLKITDNLLQNIDLTPSHSVDFIFNSTDNLRSTILTLADGEDLWGQDLAEPLIAVENIKVTPSNLTLMSKDKNPTLKIMLPDGTNIIKFRSSTDEYNTLLTSGCKIMNVVGTCAKNEWLGHITAQILLTDYEIIGEQQYYF